MPNYIQSLQLEAHEEGGCFRQVYKSSDKVLTVSDRHNANGDRQTRSSGTLIYFLLEKRRFSAWHRLKSAEIWHYYDGGSPIDIHVIDQHGNLTTHSLGNPNFTEDASFQVSIDAGCWFAAELRDKTSFGLAGCTVSPGFEYSDFELAINRSKLPIANSEFELLINKFLIPGSQIDEPVRPPASQQSFPQSRGLNASDYIKLLHLEPSNEGGHVIQFYRSKDKVIPLAHRYEINATNSQNNEERCAGTSNYLLLQKHDFLAWHRLKSDKIMHYYDGSSPIDIHVIDTLGHMNSYTLGNPNLTPAAQFQVIIPADVWVAAEVRDKSSFALVGCTISPGFDHRDFELACGVSLSAQYSQHTAAINKFTRSKTPTTSLTAQTIKYSSLAFAAGIGFYAFCSGKCLT